MTGKFLRRFVLSVLLLGLLLPPHPCIAHTEGAKEKMVALTFDDGPHPGHTDAVLDILEKAGVKATFFVIGKNVELYPAPMERAYALGHEIENHSFDHKTKGKTPESLKESIAHTSALIEEKIGYRPKFFRPPGGFATESVKTATGDLGLRQVFWTIDSEDWTGKSAGSIIRDILREANDSEVILFHDYMCPGHQMLYALPEVILGLQEKGYRFVTISEYFSYVDKK